MTNVSVIILAAGSSSRMGESKQLLKWKNETLLSHAVKTAMASRAARIYVVLGSNEEAHHKAIEKLPVTIVVNENWSKGMGSSLKAGINAAKENSEGVLVMVCDMPFVTKEHLDKLMVADQSVAASKYHNTAGVPALFKKEIFTELLAIDDQEGARKIIQNHKSSAVLIALQSPSDLDTPDDYQKALSAN